MRTSLSISEARKLVLLSQRVPPIRTGGSALSATLSTIEHLGYIQMDTISVIQRAHDHTLWNRNPRYQARHLDLLMRDKKVFEYWSHAASYLPMRDFRYSLLRKRAIASGEMEHWYARDKRLEQEVLKRIEKEGPLMARDFEAGGKRTGEWKTKPTKKALENLFMRGELMTTFRVNFQKVYDLTDRVLPDYVDTSAPEIDEYARFLITRFLEANGLGQGHEIAYLRPGIKSTVIQQMKEMELAGELYQVRVGNDVYLALPKSMALLNKRLGRRQLNILSPFDNLLIQRKRMQSLFQFDYQIECYLPAAKRRFGYFSLPLLWDGRLVARMDCRADRKRSVLHMNQLSLEPTVTRVDDFLQALQESLTHFLAFNQCRHLQVHKVSPANLTQKLQLLTRNLGF